MPPIWRLWQLDEPLAVTRSEVRGTWYIFMRSSISISISVTQLELIIKMTYNSPRRAAGNDHGLIVNCLAASRLDFDCPPACLPGSCCCCTCCTVASWADTDQMQLPDPIRWSMLILIESYTNAPSSITINITRAAASGEAITQFVNIIRSDSDALHATLSCAICHTSSGDIGRRLLACRIRIRNTYTCSYGD